MVQAPARSTRSSLTLYQLASMSGWATTPGTCSTISRNIRKPANTSAPPSTVAGQMRAIALAKRSVPDTIASVSCRPLDTGQTTAKSRVTIVNAPVAAKLMAKRMRPRILSPDTNCSLLRIPRICDRLLLRLCKLAQVRFVTLAVEGIEQDHRDHRHPKRQDARYIIGAQPPQRGGRNVRGIGAFGKLREPQDIARRRHADTRHQLADERRRRKEDALGAASGLELGLLDKVRHHR